MKKELIQFILALLAVVVVGVVMFVGILAVATQSIKDVYASTRTKYETSSTVSWTPETED